MLVRPDNGKSIKEGKINFAYDAFITNHLLSDSYSMCYSKRMKNMPPIMLLRNRIYGLMNFPSE